MTILDRVARTHYPGIWNVNPEKIEWTELADNPGNWIKVLVVDGANHRVDFLFNKTPTNNSPSVATCAPSPP